MPNLRSSVYGWKSVWMELAEEAKGEFLDNAASPSAPVKVRLPMTPWTITMEMIKPKHGKEHTRILLPFKYKSDFAFNIHNRNWVADAAKNFGLQDIIVGHEEFDRDFIIQGSDEKLVVRLFSNESFRDMIQLQRAVRLAVHREATAKHFGKVPPGIHVLAFEEEAPIDSFDRLVALLELKRTAMTQLCELGVASQQDPDFMF